MTFITYKGQFILSEAEENNENEYEVTNNNKIDDNDSIKFYIDTDSEGVKSVKENDDSIIFLKSVNKNFNGNDDEIIFCGEIFNGYKEEENDPIFSPNLNCQMCHDEFCCIIDEAYIKTCVFCNNKCNNPICESKHYAYYCNQRI